MHALMMSQVAYRILGLCFLLIAMPMQASIEKLQQQGELQINSWLSPESDIVKGQQINMQIEIASQQKWQGGVVIEHIEIENAIVLQREKFAVNSVRNENGKSWLVQLWTLVIYPQTVGDYIIPEIAVDVAVVDSDGYITKGPLLGNKLTFSVIENTAMLNSINGTDGDNVEWIASPSFSIDESFDRSFEGLKAGDALTRTLLFSAKDLPAMMLPSLALADITGVAIYSQPAQLVDKVNRGDYLAKRTEIHTYIIEQAGDYIIPKQIFYWWNTKDLSFQKIVLPEYRLKVAGSNMATILMWSLVSILCLLITVLLIKKITSHIGLASRWASLKVFLHSFSRDPNRQLERRFQSACKRGNDELALALLYQGLDRYEEHFSGVIRQLLFELDNTELRQQFESLIQHIYADNKEVKEGGEVKEVDIKLFAKTLIQEMKKMNSSKKGWFTKVNLTLN